MNNADKKQILYYSHKLHGLARHLHINELRNNAQQFEQHCGENDPKALLEEFQALRCEFDRVVSFLSNSRWVDEIKA